MALPPGTFGWVGSGFDCTCECSFVAGFHYAGGEPDDWSYVPPPICMLIFAVGNMRDGCDAIDAETADLTVDLELNGTPISEDLTYVPGAEIYYWDRWEPEAGDVYTATVTLVCGATTVTREYEFTIPDPANVACDCCDERTPDYITVLGMTGDCCDIANGTFALSAISTCVWDHTVSYSAPSTGDRCDDTVACTTITLDTRAYPDPTPFDIAYLHFNAVNIQVGIGIDLLTATMLPNPDTIQLMVTITWFVYRKRFYPDLTFECDPISGYLSRWIFESTCNSQFTLISTENTICSDTPIVHLEFE